MNLSYFSAKGIALLRSKSSQVAAFLEEIFVGRRFKTEKKT
jgi:hypothetical protein